LAESTYIVGIVVDPSCGDRLVEILARMPIWIAATDANRHAAEQIWAERPQAAFTDPGGLTTFRVDPNGTPEDWCADVLDDVAGHHDRYSHTPGFSAVEVVGVGATPRLRALLSAYRLTEVSPRADGFVASTPDGAAAVSPNDDPPPPA
jgi:hypothetical protein